jgi:hypothetical protein
VALKARTVRTIGSSSYPLVATVGHNFERDYYKAAGDVAGDVRAEYIDLEFTDPKKGGEVLRVRGIANALLSATGQTINAIHATGRVAAGKTVSGALNAIRATLEVAGTTPTPGGTLAALQLDDNIVTGATLSNADAFIRVTHSGQSELVNLLNLPAPGAKTAYLTDMFVARNADAAATHAIKIVDDAGTNYWLMVTTDTPND